MDGKGRNKEIKVEEIIKRYRWPIGVILLLSVIASGGYLLWRETKSVNDESGIMNNGEEITQLEERIQNSELKIQQLETKISETSKNETVQQSSIGDTGQVAGASTSSSAPKAAVPTGKVNLNTATAAQLDTLPGIGASYAQRIIDYRDSHGGFKNISELKNIKGIGDKTFDKLKDLVSI